MSASTTPTSTKWTFLMYQSVSTTSDYTKLVDIKDYSDIGGEREMLEITTLSDDMQHFIPGIMQLENGSLQFTCNYTKAVATRPYILSLPRYRKQTIHHLHTGPS